MELESSPASSTLHSSSKRLSKCRSVTYVPMLVGSRFEPIFYSFMKQERSRIIPEHRPVFKTLKSNDFICQCRHLTSSVSCMIIGILQGVGNHVCHVIGEKLAYFRGTVNSQKLHVDPSKL